jgi:hypothetical protein
MNNFITVGQCDTCFQHNVKVTALHDHRGVWILSECVDSVQCNNAQKAAAHNVKVTSFTEPF